MLIQLWLMMCGRPSRTMRLRTSPIADDGASLVEYALLIALIAVVCITGVTFFGQATSSSYSSSTSSLFTGN